MIIKYPKNEIVFVSYYNAAGTPIFVLTSKPSRDVYYMYEVLNSGELKRVGRSKSPIDLEEKFDVRSKMNSNT